MIKINREKLEAIIRDRLREEREPRFKELDAAYAIAQDEGGNVAAIVEKRKALREVTAKSFETLSDHELADLTLNQALEL